MGEEKTFSVLLIIGACLALVFNVILVIASIVGINSVSNSTRDLLDYNFDSLSSAARLNKTFSELETGLYKLALSAEDAEKNEVAAQSLASCSKELTQCFDNYEANITNVQEREFFYEAKLPYISTVEPMMQHMLDMAKKGSTREELLAQISAIESDIAAIKDGLSISMDYQDAMVMESGKNATRTSMNITVLMVILAFFVLGWPAALVVGTIIHYFTSKARLEVSDEKAP